jgi:lysophospholipase L1-like esterase
MRTGRRNLTISAVTAVFALVMLIPSASPAGADPASANDQSTVTYSGSLNSEVQLVDPTSGDVTETLSQDISWTASWTGPTEMISDPSGMRVPWTTLALSGSDSTQYVNDPSRNCTDSLSASPGQDFGAILPNGADAIVLSIYTPSPAATPAQGGGCQLPARLACPVGSPPISPSTDYCDPTPMWTANGGAQTYDDSSNYGPTNVGGKIVTSNLSSTITVSGNGCELSRSAPVGISCYVALGDSYSSGEGAGRYFAGTAGGKGDRCDRSQDAYSVLLARALHYSPFDGGPGPANPFAACSGARTSDITGSSPKGEGPQIDHVHPDTRLVTISIGGNDVGFGPVVKFCLTHKDCEAKERAVVRRDLATVEGKVAGVLDAIAAKAPKALIVLLGYPNFLPDKGACHPTAGVLHYLLGLSAANVKFLHDGIAELDQLLGDAAQGRTEVTYVRPDDAVWGPHTICSPHSSWFVKVNLNDAVQGHAVTFFHPTAAGQQELATEIRDAIGTGPDPQQ